MKRIRTWPRWLIALLPLFLLAACGHDSVDGAWRTDGAVTGRTPQIELKFTGDRFDMQTAYANGSPGEKIAGRWREVQAGDAKLIEFTADGKLPHLFLDKNVIACRVQFHNEKMILTNGFVGTEGMTFAKRAPDAQ